MTTRRDQTNQELAACCDSLSVEELAALETWQIDVIESTDTNWCYEPDALTWNDSIDEAVSKALYATYEQVTAQGATKDNF